MSFEELAEGLGKAVDAAGIGAIVVGAVVVGAVIATTAFGAARRSSPFVDAYRSYRRGLGRAILIGWSCWSPPTSSAPWPSSPPSRALAYSL